MQDHFLLKSWHAFHPYHGQCRPKIYQILLDRTCVIYVYLVWIHQVKEKDDINVDKLCLYCVVYVINFLVITGCKDIDDALHCTSLPNGNFEVGVRILKTYFYLWIFAGNDNLEISVVPLLRLIRYC